MRTSSKFIVLAISTFLLSLPIAIGSHSQTVRVKLPQGNWTLMAGPYSKAEHKSMPVDVMRVRTNAAQGLTIESVGLVNRTDKKVSAVRLHWFLVEKSRPEVLLKGDTEVLETNLQSGKEVQINYPVVSFDKIYRPLMRDGTLRGDFRIEVLVSEVVFDDNSTWRHGDPTYRKTISVRNNYPVGCQDQACQWNGEGGSYVCSSAQKTECSVASGGQSCTESRCAGDIE